MLATAVLVVELVVFVANNIGWLIVALAGLAIAAAGGWWALTERLPRRAVGIAGLVAGAAVIIVALVQVVQGSQSPLCADRARHCDAGRGARGGARGAGAGPARARAPPR